MIPGDHTADKFLKESVFPGQIIQRPNGQLYLFFRIFFRSFNAPERDPFTRECIRAPG